MIKTPPSKISLKNILDTSCPVVRFSQERKGFLEIHQERSRSKATVLQIKFVLRYHARADKEKIYKIVGVKI